MLEITVTPEGHRVGFGKQHDVGVDNNDFYPVSMAQLREIMEGKPANWNQRGEHHG